MKTKGAKTIAEKTIQKAFELIDDGHKISDVAKEFRLSYAALYNRVRQRKGKQDNKKDIKTGRKRKYNYVSLLNAIHECIEEGKDKEHIAMKYGFNLKTFKAYLSLYKTHNPNVVSLISFVSEYQKKKEEKEKLKQKEIEESKNIGLTLHETHFSNGVFRLVVDAYYEEDKDNNQVYFERDMYYIIGQTSVKVSPISLLYLSGSKTVYENFLAHIFNDNDVVFFEKDNTIHQKKKLKDYNAIDIMNLFINSSMFTEKMRSFETDEAYIDILFKIYTFIRENTAYIYRQSYDKMQSEKSEKFFISCLPFKKN